jgi:hypothetical protein
MPVGYKPGRRNSPAPQPPAGLTAAIPNDWLHAWRRVRVQPRVDVPAWDGSGTVRVTASVKSVGLFAATFATWETGADVRPGLAVLAPVAGYTERATGIALDVACRLGFLWRYVDGSQAGRPGGGRRPMVSEYRLTVPDDIMSGRVPLLDAGYHEPGYHPNSDQEIQDHPIPEPGSPELSDEITRTQFAPPLQDPHTDPGITVVSLSATSVEGKPDRPNSDQEMSVRVIESPLLAVVQAEETGEDARCRYDRCLTPPQPIEGDGHHARCRLLASVKARARKPA